MVKIERVDDIRTEDQVIKDTIKEEFFDGAKVIDIVEDYIMCEKQENNKWTCNFKDGKESNLNIINFLSKNGHSFTLTEDHVSYIPQRKVKCLIGNWDWKGEDKRALCGTIEDFTYFILPAYKIEL